ncbi:MAG: sulfite exporter TauE/SafE family protein [Candidatus Micrarchaeota archaeon]|nr:sulfite exporter TauE/SafE family protein [Candidatus Micrarchaeota archaeon]
MIAGFVGALTGLGGGVVLVPLLALGLGVSLAYASGASLIATIATSSGAGSAYVKERITNVKIGMGLEIATTLGAIVGALVVSIVYKLGLGSIVFVVFGSILLLSVYLMARRGKRRDVLPPDRTTKRFQLRGEYTDETSGKRVRYYGVRWWLGELIMFFAGLFSGILGIGSGALKVLGMDWAMRLPTKVSTSTSNFMIGVTAAAGSVIFWEMGYIQPFVAGVTAIGVLIGAVAGSVVFKRVQSGQVRILFMLILVALAAEMVAKGVGL